MDSEQAEKVFTVVVNDEEQYSIWPQDRPVPDGWKTEGTPGPESECIEYIERVWTDMRPRSLREEMDRQREPSAS
jgi:MbtH protein